MQKHLKILVAFVLQLSIVPTVLAEGDFMGKLNTVATEVGMKNIQGGATLDGRIQYFVSIVLSFVGVILMAYVMYAGYLWMTGSTLGSVDKAKKILYNSVIGLIVVASAFIITMIIGGLISNIT